MSLIAGIWFLFQGTKQLSYAAYLSEIRRGDLAFNEGNYDEALSSYTKAATPLFADKALLHYKVSKVYYQKGEVFFDEILDNPGLVASLIEAGADIALDYYNRALAELQQIDAQIVPENLRWKSYYQLGNIYFRKILLLKIEADPLKVQSEIDRLFREVAQYYRNALDTRPLNLSREDKILEVYLKQNLEYLMKVYESYLLEKNKVQPDIARTLDVQSRVEKIKLLMPALDLSPEAENDPAKGGKFGQGEDKGIK